MGKRFLALFLSALIVFTEITSGQMIAHATESSGEQNEISYFYQFEEPIYQLPEWTIDVEKSVGWRNEETGEEGRLSATGITLSNEDVVFFDGYEDENIWRLRTNYVMGTCDVTIAYEDLAGNSKTHTFTVNVGNDVHFVDIYNDTFFCLFV